MLRDSLIVIGSEATLALYPLLIKLIPVNLSTQLLSRFLTFSVLALALAKPAAVSQSWGSLAAAVRSTALGTLTLGHVATSYYAFEQLPSGAAMSLFYTYPLWNLLGGVLGFGETITWFVAGLILIASLGVVLVALGTEDQDTQKSVQWDGVAAALAAAITETAMYFAVRTASRTDPYFSVLELYPGALIGLGAWLLWSKTPVSTSAASWLKMTGFNTVIGFIGYALRYLVIPKVSTSVFSILSFVGVVASFLWGWLLANEVPTPISVAGATLITVASSLAS